MSRISNANINNIIYNRYNYVPQNITFTLQGKLKAYVMCQMSQKQCKCKVYERYILNLVNLTNELGIRKAKKDLLFV